MGESFGLRSDVTEKIRATLAQFGQIRKAILYGSRAKGNHKPGSDIDLTLVTEGTLPSSFLAQVAMALDELDLPWTVDLSLRHQIENEDLLAHIDRVGLLFFEAEEFEAEGHSQRNK